jgi:chromosome segregation protein
VQTRVTDLEKQWKEKESTLEAARTELANLERQETGDDRHTALQSAYEKLLEKKNALHGRELQARSKMEIAREVKKRTATVMPLSKIIETVGALTDTQSDAISSLKKAATLDAAKATAPSFEGIHASMSSLRDNLERPATAESETRAAEDPALVKELEVIAKERTALDGEIVKAQAAIRTYNESESKLKEQFFGLQRVLQEKINAAHALERQLSTEKIEVARLETRRETLEQEMVAELGERMERVKQGFAPADGTRPETLLPEIDRLKYQLQLIGGIDPEVVKEHQETQERFDYLTSQVTDLNKAIDDLDRVIAELDITIKARSESAFKKLNTDFDRYFKVLFGGGSAGLVQLKELETEDEKPAEGAEAMSAEDEAAAARKKKPKEVIAGIDIHATPPGKKISNVTMLSGGERAMTSIALICAILVNNPSPFVVLDEVDAALDESNAERYASILDELAAHTQFIVITHNRYTMRRSRVLYGVTMREDGTSALLSINLEEVDTLKNDKKPQKAAA